MLSATVRAGDERVSAKDATIKDIADKAGVSYATVSRALNGKYGVRPSTRERVLAVARRMGYRPNAIARGLVTRRTMTLGLVVPDIKNPFFPEIAGGVEESSSRRSRASRTPSPTARWRSCPWYLSPARRTARRGATW
jgi:transcriptional regulator with XRE-family HTH domain